jgi:hypothetical protein
MRKRQIHSVDRIQLKVYTYILHTEIAVLHNLAVCGGRNFRNYLKAGCQKLPHLLQMEREVVKFR